MIGVGDAHALRRGQIASGLSSGVRRSEKPFGYARGSDGGGGFLVSVP
ncbi:hypothetical protein XA26_04300 [Mycolicibacterium fortuitum]|uniref:Uncharacterized protein n=1 Tax=Mycolicibacterium fortuitum TaxID=1766 RepID=A0A0N9XDR6_MYCFO|nr:hypothetical protein XA26_04300 [Mycolicibacterium fortuitum]